MSAAKVRILIVEGRFYSELSDELLRGAADAITAVGAEYEVITVRGASRGLPACIVIGPSLLVGMPAEEIAPTVSPAG